MSTSAPDPAAAAATRPGLLEVLVALACFAVLCGAALARPVKLLEPDDYAYRASIVALTEGHVRLTDTQYRDLAARLMEKDAAAGLRGSRGISQWTQLADGRWISEKNPGYPFLAAPFEAAGVVRLAPLFYGGLGCLALFAGGRRWLGAWGGTFAVGLFCSSGSALAFAWRVWMPTFTGAALVAAGAGALLWALLARSSLRGAGRSWVCSGSSPSRERCWCATPTSSRWVSPSWRCSPCGASSPAPSPVERSGGGSGRSRSPARWSSSGTPACTAARRRPAMRPAWSPSGSARSAAIWITCRGCSRRLCRRACSPSPLSSG